MGNALTSFNQYKALREPYTKALRDIGARVSFEPHIGALVSSSSLLISSIVTMSTSAVDSGCCGCFLAGWDGCCSCLDGNCCCLGASQCCYWECMLTGDCWDCCCNVPKGYSACCNCERSCCSDRYSCFGCQECSCGSATVVFQIAFAILAIVGIIYACLQPSIVPKGFLPKSKSKVRGITKELRHVVTVYHYDIPDILVGSFVIAFASWSLASLNGTTAVGGQIITLLTGIFSVAWGSAYYDKHPFIQPLFPTVGQYKAITKLSAATGSGTEMTKTTKRSTTPPKSS